MVGKKKAKPAPDVEQPLVLEDDESENKAEKPAGSYSENDIYYLEVCTLNEMCANRDELWTLKMGDPFFCQFDSVEWQQTRWDMMALN